ncbi:MAG: hypothetical protein IJD32_07790 [Bacteroidaceae bacterium]|nr:hypothetical protein [Bacteroidaceae bacterium]MBR6622008.1 hypothetical protein [Bacteroides sp.]
MKAKTYAIILLALFSLAFTIWCLVDGIYYLALLGLFIFACQVYNYVSIKKRG